MEEFPECSLFKYRQYEEKVNRVGNKKSQDYDTIVQKSRPDPVYFRCSSRARQEGTRMQSLIGKKRAEKERNSPNIVIYT